MVVAGMAALTIYGSLGVKPGLLRLERILALLQTDPELLWRQRPGLETTFEGTAVRTDSFGFRLGVAAPAGPPQRGRARLRVVSLGASPTFGYGVEHGQAYPAVAGARLLSAHPSLEVFNAGQIGYSSWQGLKLARRHLPRWSPRLVTVSYMVNDIDRFRFYLSNGKGDRQTRPYGAARSKVINFLGSFWPTAALKRHFRRVTVKLSSSGSARGRYELTRSRCTAAEYQQNLRQIMALARVQGARLLFIKLPFQLPRPVPAAPPALAALQEQAERLLAAREDKALAAVVKEILQQDPLGSRGHYLRGRLLDLQGRQGAGQAYEQAVKNVIYDCARDARRYNMIMERLALETGTPLVDPTAILGRDKATMRYYVPGDYIHPNVEGHRLIGECLARVMERVLSGQTGPLVDRCGAEAGHVSG